MIRRGYPLLLLPGLGEEVVNTGIIASQLEASRWSEVNAKQLWGLWSQRSESGYRRWGQDVSTALQAEQGIPILWYIDRDQGLKAALVASQDPLLHKWAIDFMRQIGMLDTTMAQALVVLLTDADEQVQISAAEALGQVIAANSEAVTPQVADALVTLLDHKSGDVRASAAEAWGEVVVTSPELITPELFEALVRNVADPRSDIVRAEAAGTLGKMGAA